MPLLIDQLHHVAEPSRVWWMSVFRAVTATGCGGSPLTIAPEGWVSGLLCGCGVGQPVLGERMLLLVVMSVVVQVLPLV